MSALKYTNVSKDEIAAVLAPLGFFEVAIPGCGEVTFAKKIVFEGLDTVVRIYTAIFKESGRSRPPGSDAIRVCLGRLDQRAGTVRIFKTLPTVQRRGTWAKQLRARIDSIPSYDTSLGAPPPEVRMLTETQILAGETAPPPPVEEKCPRCNAGLTAPKQGRLGWFRGCSRYPACHGLVDVR